MNEPTLICCNAPVDATIKEMPEEHKLVRHVKETFATDVRGGIFSRYVHKYQTWDKPIWTHRRKVAHVWFRDSEEYGLWHYVDDDYLD